MTHYRFILLGFAVIFSNLALCQTIHTIAGNGSTGFLGNGGPAIAATLAPSKAWPDGTGNIYITEAMNNRIRKVNSAGIITCIAGNGTSGHSGDGGPATASTISYSQSVTTDNAGNIYFADWIYVRKINASGIISTVAGGGDTTYSGDGGPATAAGFKGITDIALDNAGNLYIVDFWDNRIRKVNSSGIISTFAGEGLVSAFDGVPASSATFWTPRSIAIDNMGNIYFTETGMNRIWKVNTAGLLSTVVPAGYPGFGGDGGPATAAKLNMSDYSGSIAADSAGNIFIGDSYNYRVRKIDPAGIINTIAGCGLPGYGGDGGPATAAYFPAISGISVDNSGNIYVSDGYYVRKIITNSTLVPDASGMKEQKAMQITPNPTNSGIISVSVFSPSAISAHITITNIIGQPVMGINTITNKATEIALDVQPGVYLVTAITKEGKATEKIIVH